MPMETELEPPFVLCAEPAAAPRTRRWRLFQQPLEVLCARSVGEVVEVLERVAGEVSAGRWVAGHLAYEAGPAFDGALECRAPAHDAAELPLVWLGVFAEPRELDDRSVHALLHEVEPSASTWAPGRTADEHGAAVQEIRRRIAAGDVYQVNYTFPFRELSASPPDGARPLFRTLDAAQRAPWAALVDGRGSDDPFQICSSSPELFFRLDGERLESRPMKGTARRGRHPGEDRALADALVRSAKDRAENLMIVDMVRNDLGRVAQPGSVTVEELFTVESYPTVHQMVSTVACRSSASIPEIFAALFPCASITGAPKVTAMRAIRDLETEPRGVYTGAIGWIGPGRRACFNVAIRTASRPDPAAAFRYGAGSGVVWESTSEDEYRECLVKARVLEAESAVPGLFETLLVRQTRGIWLLEEHLERLAGSAERFGIPFDERRVREALARRVEQTSRRLAGQRFVLRLTLDPLGEVGVETRELRSAGRECWRVALDPEPTPSTTPWLFHKTERRELYRAALSRVREKHGSCDDAILWNERGELTESTRANLLLRLDGRWHTPPVECGLLAGTVRRRLLERGRVSERRLGMDDLASASAVLLVNSVRGFVRTVLVGRSSEASRVEPRAR